MSTAGQTPSQTVGPYFSMILARSDEGAVLAGPDTPGEPIRIVGRVLDGEGTAIEDGLVELWQANAAGRYRHPADDRGDVALDDGFTGFGRARTSFEDGTFTFDTIRPGRVPHPDGGLQAPHCNLVVQARGMLNPSWTRLYFPDEQAANEADPVLAGLDPARRHTLVATVGEGTVATFHFDVCMQGVDATVLLDW